MSLQKLRSLLTGMAVAATSLLSMQAPALAEFPERPMKIVVGYEAGGGTDTYARVLASLIHEELNGTPMVIINKPGASSMVALKFVADQPADGYTLLLQAVGSSVVNELIGKSPVEFRKDMVPVALLGEVPSVLAVPFDSPYRNLKELVDAIKANPGKLRWANPGRADILGFGFERVTTKLELAIKDVPFKGGGPTKAALIAGQTDMGIIGIQHLVGFETKLRGLGVFASERSAIKEDVPTFAEQGYDVPYIGNPFAIYVKAGTPDDVLQKLRDAVAKVTQLDGYKKLILQAGLNDGYVDADKTSALVNKMFEDLSN